MLTALLHLAIIGCAIGYLMAFWMVVDLVSHNRLGLKPDSEVPEWAKPHHEALTKEDLWR